MESSNLNESESDNVLEHWQDNAEEDEDSEAPGVAVIVTKKGRGKPVNEIWELFTDAIAAQQLTSGNNCFCKHCKENVRHHNKTNSVKRHLKNCRQFGELMKNTAVADRPEWFDCKVKKSQSISNVLGSTQSSVQPSMRNYVIAKVTKNQLDAMHETLAMHYFCTGTAFKRIEDEHLLKAFQLINPSVTLPDRKRLGGKLLEICFKKVKIEVTKLLSCTTQFVCITSDGWSNISNEAVVNYMAITPSNTLFLEAVNTAEQGHTAEWIAADIQRVFGDSCP